LIEIYNFNEATTEATATQYNFFCFRRISKQTNEIKVKSQKKQQDAYIDWGW